MISKPLKSLEDSLCGTFCSGVSVNALPHGYAISTIFEDGSGDRISFYAIEDGEGFRLEDDGDYLAHLVGMGIEFEKGQRAQLLEGILGSANAHWDAETYEIKRHGVSRSQLGKASIEFISALMRVRDLELLTRDFIRSTFRDDATAAIREQFDKAATIEENTPLSTDYQDYVPDLVLRPHDGGRDTAVFLASSPVPFQEAELLHSELDHDGRLREFGVVAFVEDNAKIDSIGRRRFQRANNRGLRIPIFRGDERSAVRMIGLVMNKAA